VFMNKDFFEKKITVLSDAKLLTLANLAKANPLLSEVVHQELLKRTLTTTMLDNFAQDQVVTKAVDRSALDKFKWAAFLLTPIWCLVFKLDRWAIWWHIPLVNVIVMLHLGIYGNRMAYEINSMYSVKDFMELQQYWKKLLIRLICLNLGFFSFYLIWLMVFE
jgi:hypothetical protein